MYSSEWFEIFAATVPADLVDADVSGIAAHLALATHPRLLDVGTGIGRIAGPLARSGYAVTGIDINVGALRTAKIRAPGVRYLALDQQHVARMAWTFDGALVLWNSLGFVGRDADRMVLSGLAGTLRPGGKLVLDLYHPDWLSRNDRAGEVDARGASVRRWTRGGRCFHEIRYPNGTIDDIQFEVYQPREMHQLCRDVGLEPEIEMSRWSRVSRPTASEPRYQMICPRRA